MKIISEGKGVYIGQCEDCGTVFEASEREGEVYCWGETGCIKHTSRCPICRLDVNMALVCHNKPIIVGDGIIDCTKNGINCDITEDVK